MSRITHAAQQPSRLVRRQRLSVLAALLALLGMLVPFAPAAQAVDSPQGRLVSDQPANGTPHVLDGGVYSIAQVGGTIVLGGTFSSARNDSSQTTVARHGLLAFDANTGTISTTFVPEPNGNITTVVPAGDGTSVYVAGSFSSIGGVARSNLARIRVSDGAVITAFNAGTVSGNVKDLRLQDGRLWLAGAFTHVNGHAQKGLATVDAATGAFLPYMGLGIAGVHNGGYTTVSKIDISPDGSRLVAIGNFDTLDGVKNHQMFLLDLSGGTAAPTSFHTSFYESTCSRSFDSYMRDLDFSPDGSFFVVSTTGAYGGAESACDQTSRWETGATGANVRPSWTDYTGGDTTYAVLITDSAVYTGGHARWQNNAYAGDQAGPGAVARPGIAALDPINGLPLSWNPTRTRGVGVFDFMVTSQGLWVASDTDRIGAYRYHGRIALMPLAGQVIPAVSTPTLPNDIYVAGGVGAATDPSVLYRVNAGGDTLPASTGIDWDADTSGSPSPYHNPENNRASYSAVGNVDSTVPSGTPRALFDSELWDAAAAPEQTWNFPVDTGTPLQVRLYFANRCTCTSQPGQRKFDVDLEGTRVLDDFDITAAVGTNTGTMRSFDITSDGNVDIDLSHVVENPTISGIEIVRTDLGTAPESTIVRRSYDGGTVGASMVVPTGGIDWNRVRGAFMLNGQLYLAQSDGSFTRRTFNGTSYGSPVAVDTQDELNPLLDWKNDIQSATGMFYDSGRIYFTRSGSSQLYYRYFTPESDVVGTKRLVASGNVAGIDFAQVRGMFTTGTRLFWAKPDGSLNRIDWQDGDQSDVPVGGTATQVSGPGIDTDIWTSRALFLHQDSDGDPAGQPPVADFTASCTSLTCDFDASGSTATAATITSYSWQFGDGGTASGATPSHTYAGSGTRQVTLQITTSKGEQATTTQDVTVTKTNEAPSASFASSCTQLDCEFDATGSSDPDGDNLTYSWNFGDGQNGTGATPSHSYATAGQRTVTLTVSDGTLTDSTTRQVNPSQAAQGDVAFVDAASTSGNRSTHRVQVPDTVQAGDTLVLFLTTNSTSTTVDDSVAGWTLLESQDGNGIRGRAWTRTATASDAGSNVTVSTSGYAKSVLSVSAYRGAGGADTTVTASASDVVNSASTNHTAPDVNVSTAGSWLVNYWGEKSSGDTTWTPPAGEPVRTTDAAAGGGKASALLSDTDGPIATGTATGRTATTSTSVGRTVMFTVVIAPQGGGSPPANQAPSASFASSCTQLDCEFDATGSSDPDGDNLTYSWNFGDGQNGTGATPSHSYATAGQRTVTLTVSDGTLTDSTTRQVNPSQAAQGDVAFVDAASTSGNRSTHRVQVPDTVQAGDTLVLFLTTNSTSTTVDDSVAGWTLLESQDGTGIRGRAWTRTATASDAGSNVTVSTSGYTKSVLSVSAYRGAGGADTTVTASASDGGYSGDTTQTAPDVAVSTAGSWLVNYWGEKSSSDTTWTPPAGQPVRTTDAASGGGKTSALLSDSDGPVATGTATGRTATTANPVGRTVTFSLVIAPQ